MNLILIALLFFFKKRYIGPILISSWKINFNWFPKKESTTQPDLTKILHNLSE